MGALNGIGGDRRIASWVDQGRTGDRLGVVPAPDVDQTQIEAFYDKLGDSAYTKAEALRSAQLELKNRPEFAHPFFWSPFLMINNWF